MTINNFDIQKYPFRSVITEIIKDKDLENLHKVANYNLFSREKDNSTIWYSRFMENHELFLPFYYHFISEFIKPTHFSDETEIIVQKIPSIRIQLVNNVAVGEWHRDRDYNHNLKSINFHLPFTNTNEYNSIWCETENGKEDYVPFILNYGQYIIFDSINLKHGNKVNKSNETRVSIDFRIIKGSEYIEEENAVSINSKTPFKVGDAYIKM